jgi:hypothetical protein
MTAFFTRLKRGFRRAPITQDQANLLASIKFPCC